MNRPHRIWRFALCVGLSLAATHVLADLPKPPVPPPTEAAKEQASEVPPGRSARAFKVTTDRAKQLSVLRIPRKEFDAIVAENAQKQTSAAPLKTQSIVAALAASIGVASVVFLRMNRQTKIVMLFIVALIGSGVAADAWWNIPRPPDWGRTRGSIEHSGQIVVEVTETGPIELSIGTKSPPFVPTR